MMAMGTQFFTDKDKPISRELINAERKKKRQASKRLWNRETDAEAWLGLESGFQLLGKQSPVVDVGGWLRWVAAEGAWLQSCKVTPNRVCPS